MADYSIFSQPQGPVIDTDLYVNAAKSGIDMGNAQKTNTQAALEGITQGVNTGMDLYSKYQNQQITQQQIDTQPAKDQADIEAKLAAAEHNRSLATQQSAKAQAQAEEDALYSSISQALANQDAEAINQIAASPQLMKQVVKDPKKFEPVAEAMASVPGTNPEIVGRFSDFTEIQKIKAAEAAKRVALQGKDLEAQAALESSLVVQRAANRYAQQTGSPHSMLEVAAGLETEQAGKFTVVDGKMVPKPSDGLPSDASMDGKVDVFMRGSRNGKDYYYQVGEGEKAEDLAKAVSVRGTAQVFSGRSESDQIAGVKARRADKVAQYRTTSGQSADPTQRKMMGREGESFVVTPPEYEPERPPREMQTFPKDEDLSRPDPREDTYEAMNALTMSGTPEEIPNVLVGNPTAKKIMASDFGITEKQLEDNSQAIAVIYKNAAEYADSADSVFGGIANQFGSDARELRDAKKSLAKARAAKDLEVLKLKSVDAPPNSFNSVQLRGYSEEALRKYKLGRESVTGIMPAVYATIYGWGKYWAELSKYPEDANSVEDLYYIKHKTAYDTKANAAADKLRENYKEYKRSPMRAIKAADELLQEKSQTVGTKAPIIENVQPPEATQQFSSLSKLSGSASTESLPDKGGGPSFDSYPYDAVELGAETPDKGGGPSFNSPPYDAVELGAEIGQVTALMGPEAEEVKPMTKEEAQDHALSMAKKYNVPPELVIGLGTQESRWTEDARSKVGAIGYMQLMPGTAKELGIDPMDPKQNIEGGVKYLAQMYKRFGDWKLAIQAYNAGPGNVRKYKGKVPFKETKGHLAGVLKAAKNYVDKNKTYA
jgi:hypothetical protein